MNRKFTDEDIEQALSHDPLATAEGITGHSYKSDKGTGLLGMGLHIKHADAKRTLLEDAGDTTFSMEIDKYMDVVTNAGFELVLELPFHSEQHDKDDVFRVMFHDDGILLAFDTFGGKSVNSGNFYYNVRFQEKRVYGATSSGCSAKSDPTVWCGDHDCREALVFNIRRLRKHGEFLRPWIQRPFLWLCHYGDKCEENRGDGYRRITASRIAMLPKHVQDCIGEK